MKKTYLTTALMLAAVSGSLMAQTVVTVNGTKIDSSQIDAVVSNLRQNNKQVQDSPALREEVARRLAVSTVIAQEAKRLKLDQSEQFKKFSAEARANAKQQGADKQPSFPQEWALFETDLLNRAYMAEIAGKNPVSENDVRQTYAQMTDFYKGSQEVQLGEILTRSEGDAQKAYGELQAKKSFKSVAGKYTINPQAKKSGGIAPGYIPLKDLAQSEPGIFDAVKDLKKGAYTAPIRSDDGQAYAIFYINDSREARLPAFDTMKGQLADQLQQARIAKSIDDLMKKADIKPAK